MPHILKNNDLEIVLDLPHENYTSSRFDWTGKIVKVKFQNILLSGNEITDVNQENNFGKGFYNEFGIDTALGFDEAKNGEWFHKIGVGLLKKEDDKYLFHKNYKIKPAKFSSIIDSNRILMTCRSEYVNGYSYILKKELELFENKFKISYKLKNTGEKVIMTNEYNHNFICINKDFIGKNYELKFPFHLKPEKFIEYVNQDKEVEIEQYKIKFNSIPKKPFFFSNLSGNESIDATWELINIPNKIIVSEKGNFQTNRVNLWGHKHIISPELFMNLHIKPGKSFGWDRIYSVKKL